MTKEQKLILDKIKEIENIIDTEETVGGGIASDEFYEPVEGRMLALKEQLSFLNRHKDMMERSRSSQLRSWGLKVLLFFYDMIVVNFAYFLAVIVRFSDSDSYRSQGHIYMDMFRRFTPWYMLMCLILFISFRIYSGVWRYAGSNDVRKLTLLNLITCIIYIIGSLFVVGRMPITVYVAGAAIQFVLMCAPRLAPRFFVDSYLRSKGEISKDAEIPLMIVGVGENARIIQNKIRKDLTSRVKPVCVIDYTYSCAGKTFNGLPVYSGPYAVYECIKKFGIRVVVIADEDIPKDLHKSIRKICNNKNIEFRDFVIGTDESTSILKARELFETIEGTVRVIGEGMDEKQYIDGKAALKDIKSDRVVDKVSVSDGTLVVQIHKKELENADSADEWINNIV